MAKDEKSLIKREKIPMEDILSGTVIEQLSQAELKVLDARIHSTLRPKYKSFQESSPLPSYKGHKPPI